MILCVLLSLIILLTFNLSFSLAQEWTYEGQYIWRQQFPECGGRLQSPINIDTRKLIKDRSLGIKFINYDIPYANLIANNNGHTIRITLGTNTIKPGLSVQGVDNNGEYELEELHFHWGDNNFQGSEHSIDDYYGSAELHFVHINKKYGNIENARQNTDGIVVLTVISQLSRSDNPALEPIIRVLPHTTKYNANQTIANQIVFNKLLPKDKQIFFSYRGSLTTPPCSESVQFIIYAEPIRMSPIQLSQFRRLFQTSNTRKIVFNTRDVQKRNGRLVHVSVPRRDTRYYGNGYRDKDYYNQI